MIKFRRKAFPSILSNLLIAPKFCVSISSEPHSMCKGQFVWCFHQPETWCLAMKYSCTYGLEFEHSLFIACVSIAWLTKVNKLFDGQRRWIELWIKIQHFVHIGSKSSRKNPHGWSCVCTVYGRLRLFGEVFVFRDAVRRNSTADGILSLALRQTENFILEIPMMQRLLAPRVHDWLRDTSSSPCTFLLSSAHKMGIRSSKIFRLKKSR